MRSDSVKAGELLLKIASAARRRRLEVQRIRNFGTSMDDDSSKHGVDSRISSDGCRKKRRSVIELASPDQTSPVVKMSKVDISGLTAEMASSSSMSSSETSPGSGGGPAGIQISGGEFSGEGESGSLTYVSHGSISVIGRRRAMEDAVTVAPGVLAGEFASSYDFFAVYDGHGGSSVSQACRGRMHQLLAMEVEGWTRGGNGGGGGGEWDWEKAMSACFQKMDDEVNCCGGDEGAGSSSSSTAMIGSTAVVVVVGMKEIVVANCGDSRAVLCRGDVPVPLSRDHKPDRPDERERVEAAGGKVINWNGCRVLGVLATSRSIGDQYLKPYVISEPEVTVNERTKSDSFIIVASDGLWDVLSNEVACEVVRRCLGGQVKRRFAEELNGSYSMEAAAMLAELAMARGSKDNISVIVVELKKLSESTS